MISNYDLEYIGRNSSLIILICGVLSMFLFAGSREVIFSFYDYIIEVDYSYDKIGYINGWIECIVPFSFLIHGAVRFFGYDLFEGREKLKAYFLIIHIALIIIVYIVYLYLIFRFLNTL